MSLAAVNLAAVNLGHTATMFTMTLKEIQEITNATLIGDESTAGSSLDSGCIVRGINTDSRTIKHDELFVALKGDNYDAHDFLSHASDRGASAYLLERDIAGFKPALVVKNTRLAFGQIAKAWRDNFNIPVVAVTGSNGKTTVKEMLNSILAMQGNVLATKGNFNNEIGVPITLYRLSSNHDSAVIEMGANHMSEISYLTSLVSPDVAIITNAGTAHLEGFGSLDNIAKAKGEIFEGLSEEGTAILNYDDSQYGYWKKLIGTKKSISFGENINADVSYILNADGSLQIRIKDAGDFTLRLPLLGQHNIFNALAAVAAAVSLKVKSALIKQGLESMQVVPGRLEKKIGVNNSIVIDDTYNANPDSLDAAIKTIASFPGIHHFVLGDMGELGEDSVELHKKAAASIKQDDVKYLYTLGENSELTSNEFGVGAQHFSSHDELVKQLIENIKQDDVVLVKGSRSMQMEKIVNSICIDTPMLEPGQE